LGRLGLVHSRTTRIQTLCHIHNMPCLKRLNLQHKHQKYTLRTTTARVRSSRRGHTDLHSHTTLSSPQEDCTASWPSVHACTLDRQRQHPSTCFMQHTEAPVRAAPQVHRDECGRMGMPHTTWTTRTLCACTCFDPCCSHKSQLPAVPQPLMIQAKALSQSFQVHEQIQYHHYRHTCTHNVCISSPPASPDALSQ